MSRPTSPVRAPGITIECTPDATAVITWTTPPQDTQFVVRVNGVQVHTQELDSGGYRTTVAVKDGDVVTAGAYTGPSAVAVTPPVEAVCLMPESPDRSTTTTSTTTTTPVAVTATTSHPLPDTLPYTGPPTDFGLATVLLALGTVLVWLTGRKSP